MRNFINELLKTIIFGAIVVGLILGAEAIVNVLENIITMDMIMKCVYFTLGLILIHFIKESR